MTKASRPACPHCRHNTFQYSWALGADLLGVRCVNCLQDLSDYFARRGFDLTHYRTIRNRSHLRTTKSDRAALPALALPDTELDSAIEELTDKLGRLLDERKRRRRQQRIANEKQVMARIRRTRNGRKRLND